MSLFNVSELAEKVNENTKNVVKLNQEIKGLHATIKELVVLIKEQNGLTKGK